MEPFNFGKTNDLWLVLQLLRPNYSFPNNIYEKEYLTLKKQQGLVCQLIPPHKTLQNKQQNQTIYV